MADAVRVLHRSERRLYVRLDRTQLGVRVPEPQEAGTTLLLLTGSAAHLDGLRQVATERGMTFPTPAAAEEEIYARLALPFIPPEIRAGDDEIRAARDGWLPALVSRADIRGDLHMHSTWSDGRDPVEEMVKTCLSLGYEYLAITDHSQRSAASRKLSLDGVRRQADEIVALRERYPEIAILHGCEVDILPDARLDFPDRILEGFDIVLASLHDGAGHSRDQLMQRYLAAMRHPMVNVITHPTNRLVPHQRGYDLDYPRLFEAAADTGTAVEIDGAPAHLDLDGALARKATAAGAMVVIDSDSHRAELLDRHMRLGIVTARRGWVEPRHVLNTRPLADLRSLVAGKRR
jgi:DNA polymerase (family X)